MLSIIMVILLSSKHIEIYVSIKQNMAIRMPDQTLYYVASLFHNLVILGILISLSSTLASL